MMYHRVAGRVHDMGMDMHLLNIGDEVGMRMAC
jgi:D-arabinose 1-dehydrogenase-like Zn-dependent alcohol dehydrogenase